MGFINDDGVTATGDILAPLGCLLRLILRRFIGRISAGGLQQTPHHERELLQRRDRDFRPVDEGLRQLL